MHGRLGFIAEKYTALLARRPPRRSRPRIPRGARTPSELGTFQSTIADVYEMIVRSRILSATPTVVDVGANVGQFSWALKLFVPGAHVRCFEADPKTFESLCHNLADLPDIEPVNHGVADRETVLPFARASLSLTSSFAGNVDEPREVINLSVAPLDRLCSDLDAIDLLKVDVEGFELSVVQGARGVLSRSRWLLIEVSAGSSQRDRNLEMLAAIRECVPSARIVAVGRPLMDARGMPACQDVLICLPR